MVDLSPQLSEEMIRTAVVQRVIGEEVDLTQVDNLVIGGRGLAGDFGIIQKLATLIDGDYGGTRPPVDDGHIDRERMVGQTGVICRPKVAICCAISGAFHFVVGIQESDTVIAINNDPQAPIFDHADYCIVGDVHEILPLLVQKLEVGSVDSSSNSLEAAYG